MTASGFADCPGAKSRGRSHTGEGAKLRGTRAGYSLPCCAIPANDQATAASTVAHRRRGGDVGDLTAPLRRHRRPGQIRATPAAHLRRAGDDLIGFVHELHGRSRLGRLPSPALMQPPVPALFLYGLSEDGGLDDVAESLRACRSSCSTCAVSSPVSQYASASRAASSAAGRADNSSSEGTPGAAGTSGNDHHAGQAIKHPPRRVSRASPPATTSGQRAAGGAAGVARAGAGPVSHKPRRD